MTQQRAQLLRDLPSVHALLDDRQIRQAAEGVSADIVRGVVRRTLDKARTSILADSQNDPTDIIEAVIAELNALLTDDMAPLINATGVIIQTNLGRAPVSTAAARAMATAAASYVALETDLVTGRRGGRGTDVELLMSALTGAERTLIVNNNAAAVMLTLATVAAGRDVIVSRGEAVEIGGGFRIPDVLRQSGARLVEVGTTNRTYVRDYAEAIDDRTAAVLRVHASNFAQIGFTARPELDDLAQLCHERGVPLIEDVGSGCLLDTRPFGISHEPTLGESIAAGADLVCASGDKLLGGPQAGLILGSANLVGRVARHPLARALRADKACLAGLAATLRHYVRNEAIDQIPVWWAISRPVDWLEARARSWAVALDGVVTVVSTESVVGGGSLPGKTLPSFGIALPADNNGPAHLAQRLRTGTPPVIPRIVDDVVVIDARTVLSGEDQALIDAVRVALG